jgi:hypothetical protein
MSDWKPYAVVATIATMKLNVSSCRRRYRWRISDHATPGTKGDLKRKHGRESIVDQVSLLLTVPEVDQLVKIADREDPVLWTHPLLPPFKGHIEDLDIPAETNVYGYFASSFNVAQAFDSAAQSLNQPGVPSPKTSQAKVNNLYNDFLTDMDQLDDIPTDASGTDFNNAADAMGTAFNDVDGAFDDITDPLGDGTWRDLSRELDAFTAVSDTFIDAAREIEESVGSLSHSIQTAPLLIRAAVGEAIENLKAPAGTVASFVTQQPSDLFSMMHDAGVKITETNIATLMEDNAIQDPLFISAGLTIAIPVAA